MNKLFSVNAPQGVMDIFGWTTNGAILSVLCALEGSGQAPAWQVLSPQISKSLIDGTQGLMQESFDMAPPMPTQPPASH